jgi:methyl-accepting chemotaxis protein
MGDIALKIENNATKANSADQIVREMKNTASAGNGKIEEMVASMSDIRDSSNSISKVIKTIDDIAFQTNILALNATVEAARAGVHGKGFAVVAEEVKNLADKSAKAAKETAEMIQTSIDKVETGNRLGGDVVNAVGEIMKSIEDVVEIVGGIAEGSAAQATAVAQMNQAIAQVSQVVQNNSETSQQCASASEELAGQAKSLKDLLEDYKLK